MTIYGTIKAAISVKQAAEHYGLKVNRNGMACCPFHNDRHPSLKLNEDYFFCFGCGAKGDVIDLVARLFNLSSYFLRDRKRGYEDAIIEHFVFQVVPILREYVKDGILDATENLVPLEHSPAEIFDAGSGEEQVTLLSENIMLYVKEFGNLTKSNATIDNEYVGKFIDELRKEFSY